MRTHFLTSLLLLGTLAAQFCLMPLHLSAQRVHYTGQSGTTDVLNLTGDVYNSSNTKVGTITENLVLEMDSNKGSFSIAVNRSISTTTPQDLFVPTWTPAPPLTHDHFFEGIMNTLNARAGRNLSSNFRNSLGELFAVVFDEQTDLVNDSSTFSHSIAASDSYFGTVSPSTHYGVWDDLPASGSGTVSMGFPGRTYSGTAQWGRFVDPIDGLPAIYADMPGRGLPGIPGYLLWDSHSSRTSFLRSFRFRIGTQFWIPPRVEVQGGSSTKLRSFQLNRFDVNHRAGRKDGWWTYGIGEMYINDNDHPVHDGDYGWVLESDLIDRVNVPHGNHPNREPLATWVKGDGIAKTTISYKDYLHSDYPSSQIYYFSWDWDLLNGGAASITEDPSTDYLSWAVGTPVALWADDVAPYAEDFKVTVNYKSGKSDRVVYPADGIVEIDLYDPRVDYLEISADCRSSDDMVLDGSVYTGGDFDMQYQTFQWKYWNEEGQLNAWGAAGREQKLQLTSGDSRSNRNLYTTRIYPSQLPADLTKIEVRAVIEDFTNQTARIGGINLSSDAYYNMGYDTNLVIITVPQSSPPVIESLTGHDWWTTYAATGHAPFAEFEVTDEDADIYSIKLSAVDLNGTEIAAVQAFPEQPSATSYDEEWHLGAFTESFTNEFGGNPPLHTGPFKYKLEVWDMAGNHVERLTPNPPYIAWAPATFDEGDLQVMAANRVAGRAGVIPLSHQDVGQDTRVPIAYQICDWNDTINGVGCSLYRLPSDYPIDVEPNYPALLASGTPDTLTGQTGLWNRGSQYWGTWNASSGLVNFNFHINATKLVTDRSPGKYAYHLILSDVEDYRSVGRELATFTGPVASDVYLLHLVNFTTQQEANVQATAQTVISERLLQQDSTLRAWFKPSMISSQDFTVLPYNGYVGGPYHYPVIEPGTGDMIAASVAHFMDPSVEANIRYFGPLVNAYLEIAGQPEFNEAAEAPYHTIDLKLYHDGQELSGFDYADYVKNPQTHVKGLTGDVIALRAAEIFEAEDEDATH